MLKRLLTNFFLFLLMLVSPSQLIAQGNQHPSLLITNADGILIKKNVKQSLLLKKSFDEAKKIADKAIDEKMDVPFPKDPAGGYTHDRHKNNYTAMYNAGLVYTITGEIKYADFITGMLLKYAELIPILKNHPQAKGSSPGRLFHQALNDANWLVYSAMAYDCIYNYANAVQRKKIEDGAFRPLCKFLTIDLKDWFNLIHNHAVWACAAVGMTGLVIGDDTMVQQALYGTNKDGQSGFIAQLDNLFSPDGYYTEGPYYARYALLPFYLFAEALQNNRPQLKIFEHRNQILKKALYAALQQTNTNGAFFSLNDAIKDKTYISSEMVFAINIAFKEYGQDEALLNIAAKQKKVLLNSCGMKVADAISNFKGSLPEFPYASVEYTDGADGKQGGISILRSNNTKSLATLVVKYASHGLTHGHYDELNMLLYDNGNEILQDYGAARFLNVEQKDGGRYLPENKSFAMQTIAHNTMVVDEKSQFDGKENIASSYHSSKYFSSLNDKIQVVSAKDSNAYKGVVLQRTLFMVSDEKSNKPICIDIFKVASAEEHQYDLPFWYNGQLIATSFKYDAFTETQQPLGSKNGYQHIWKEATGKTNTSLGTLTFLNGNSYYSICSNADEQTAFYLARVGASDPNFNLRRETGYIIRKKGRNQLFVSVIEPHGNFNPVSESSSGSQSSIKEIATELDNDKYSVVKIIFTNGTEWKIFIVNNDNADIKHSLEISGKIFSWAGPYFLNKTK
ncbi:alginate lyase family protein [Sediminibacterium sp.]|uniref:alginate lyase family protein n=1 Tax=Sediminibacterium sp. TaxID=1917865 RepID=UPI0026008644|nr:alginate lyase family protein [Sediminibacterium sp.]MBW0178502.1 heparinase II/III family protein [Sediminibacterium sp.]